MNKGFFCINTDTKSRVGHRGQRDSNLDLLFGTEGVVSRVEYSQIDDTWGSDHHPISFCFDDDVRPYRKLTNKITTRKTNWQVFHDTVNREIEMKLLPHIDSFGEDIDAYYSEFIDIVRSVTDRATGRRRGGEMSNRPHGAVKRGVAHR